MKNNNSKITNIITVFINRVSNINSKPNEEWSVIESEKPNQIKLAVYAIILAAISFLAIFIKFAFIGTEGYPEGNITMGLEYGLYHFFSSLIMAYILAWFVDLRAISNNSSKDFGRSLQLVIYSFTPYWLAGVIYIFGLNFQAIIQVIGLFSIYLIYLGLPIIKKTPNDKVLIYMINIVIGIFILRYLLGILPAYIF